MQFVIRKLQPATNYQLTLYSIGAGGRSPISRFGAETLRPAEKLIDSVLDTYLELDLGEPQSTGQNGGQALLDQPSISGAGLRNSRSLFALADGRSPVIKMLLGIGALSLLTVLLGVAAMLRLKRVQQENSERNASISQDSTNDNDYKPQLKSKSSGCSTGTLKAIVQMGPNSQFMPISTAVQGNNTNGTSTTAYSPQRLSATVGLPNIAITTNTAERRLSVSSQQSTLVNGSPGGCSGNSRPPYLQQETQLRNGLPNSLITRQNNHDISQLNGQLRNQLTNQFNDQLSNRMGFPDPRYCIQPIVTNQGRYLISNNGNDRPPLYSNSKETPDLIPYDGFCTMDPSKSYIAYGNFCFF